MANQNRTTKEPVFCKPSGNVWRNERGHGTRNPFDDAARQNNKEYGKQWHQLNEADRLELGEDCAEYGDVFD